MKRRKVARIPSSDAAAMANMMQRMDLEAGPLGDVTDSPLRERRRPSSRKASQGTAFRVPSGSTPTARRVSNAPKQPLGLDLTFGNSPSTVRHFKRVSSGERRAALSSNPAPNVANPSFHPNPQARTFRPSPPTSDHPLDTNNENAPPDLTYPPLPVTKDALYGRRAYSKVLDSVFQEAHSDTASPHQREAIARVAQAFQHLDEVDPQGEFLLLKSIIDRLKGDAKLSAALGIDVSPPAQSASPRKTTTHSTETSWSGTTVHGTRTSRHDNEIDDTTPTQVTSPIKPTSNNCKLVLATSNPHLKSHRRRQSAFVVGERGVDKESGAGVVLDEKKLPGYVEKGMEQQGFLADILYGQWMQGIRGRWSVG